MDHSSFSDEQLAELIQWVKVISEPKRLLLLEKIIQGYQCNCELGKELDIAPNLISHHLGLLRDSGLVMIERDLFDARWIYYSVNPEALKKLGKLLGNFLDPDRIQARRLTCGPQIGEDHR